MKFVYIVLFSIVFLSCWKEENKGSIILPSTPVLTVQSRWGVVSGSYIRITHMQDRHNKIIATLRKGDIVEVLSKETEKDSDNTSYWFEVKVDQIHGVVPENQLDLYDSKAKAVNASTQM